MAAEYSVYLLKFIGTPNIEFNDTSGTVWGAKIDTIVDGAPLSIRENIEEVIMSDDAVDTADGKFRPTTVLLTGKIWHATDAKLAFTALVAFKAACYGITVPGYLRFEWKSGGAANVGKIDHCASFDYHGSDGMRTIEFEVTFTVLEAGL
jgi:hypothetical protein